MKKVIAVVGMAGSGKTEVVKYLKDKLNCPNVYFGDATFERMRADGLEQNYENERLTREKIRQELGMGAYGILSLPKIKAALETNDFCLAESLYSWSEYKILKENFGDQFLVIAVFASPALRFKRLGERKNETNRQRHFGRSETKIDMDDFIKRDYTEIENIEKGGPIARADFTIINEGTIDEMKEKIDNIVVKISK